MAVWLSFGGAGSYDVNFRIDDGTFTMAYHVVLRTAEVTAFLNEDWYVRRVPMDASLPSLKHAIAYRYSLYSPVGWKHRAIGHAGQVCQSLPLTSCE